MSSSRYVPDRVYVSSLNAWHEISPTALKPIKGQSCFTRRLELIIMLSTLFSGLTVGSFSRSLGGQGLEHSSGAPRCVQPLLIEAAHKKGGGSTKNGRDSNAKRRGVKVYGGQPVKAGGIIVRQVGCTVSDVFASTARNCFFLCCVGFVGGIPRSYDTSCDSFFWQFRLLCCISSCLWVSELLSRLNT